MTKKDYQYWKARLDQYDDLPDGAWWSACEGEIGGYDKFMAWLEASKIYEKKVRNK
jgi:hypothetical protein